MNHVDFLQEAIQLAQENVKQGGGPFGALVVKDGAVIGRGQNQVTADNDPTAHAEVMAIRDACKKLQSFQLTDCIVYSSCEPCPMCFGALFWARPQAIYYAATAQDAAQVGFDDAFIYEQLAKRPTCAISFIQIQVKQKCVPFDIWQTKQNRIHY